MPNFPHLILCIIYVSGQVCYFVHLVDRKELCEMVHKKQRQYLCAEFISRLFAYELSDLN